MAEQRLPGQTPPYRGDWLCPAGTVSERRVRTKWPWSNWIRTAARIWKALTLDNSHPAQHRSGWRAMPQQLQRRCRGCYCC